MRYYSFHDNWLNNRKLISTQGSLTRVPWYPPGASVSGVRGAIVFSRVSYIPTNADTARIYVIKIYYEYSRNDVIRPNRCTSRGFEDCVPYRARCACRKRYGNRWSYVRRRRAVQRLSYDFSGGGGGRMNGTVCCRPYPAGRRTVTRMEIKYRSRRPPVARVGRSACPPRPVTRHARYSRNARDRCTRHPPPPQFVVTVRSSSSPDPRPFSIATPSDPVNSRCPPTVSLGQYRECIAHTINCRRYPPRRDRCPHTRYRFRSQSLRPAHLLP